VGNPVLEGVKYISKSKNIKFARHLIKERDKAEKSKER